MFALWSRLPLLIGLLSLGCEAVASERTLLEAREGFQTKLLREESMGSPAEKPPPDELKFVRYQAPLGRNAAYISPDPQDGGRHPAVIWLSGGFSNSIGSTAWTPGPRSNDQSATRFREKGVVTMYPSLRGGNDNPGKIETFFGEVEDVLAAARYLAGRDYVDPAKIYLAGHSTGGTLALLVAAAAQPGQFRAVFALGPVDDVSHYGADALPYDTSDDLERQVREPIRWLPLIRVPTYVFEGTRQPGNIDALRRLYGANRNGLVQFEAVNRQDHFSVIGVVVDEIANSIIADRERITYPFSYVRGER